MILDAELHFSDAQAITADVASTNIIDFVKGGKPFIGEPLGIVVSVDVAADAANADETYTFRLQTDDNTGFTTPTELMSHPITAGQLTVGSKHVLPVPVGATTERYVRLYYDVGGTTPSMTITAFLQPLNMVDNRHYYADNSVIS